MQTLHCKETIQSAMQKKNQNFPAKRAPNDQTKKKKPARAC